MHYKMSVTCVYNGHVFYTLFVITQQSNPPISQYKRLCNEFTSVWSIFVYNTLVIIALVMLVNLLFNPLMV